MTGAILLAATIYLVLDLVYIHIARPVYAAAVAQVQKRPMVVNGAFAVAAYLVLIGGWWLLVASQIKRETSWMRAASLGAVFGLCVYGTFNFTAGAMFSEYNGRVVYQDLLWGTSAAALISLIYKALLARQT